MLFALWLQILVDSSGSLKYDDFSLARLEEENLDDIFDMTSAEGTSDQTKQGGGGTATSTLGKLSITPI